jgi:hypothetical protein
MFAAAIQAGCLWWTCLVQFNERTPDGVFGAEAVLTFPVSRSLCSGALVTVTSAFVFSAAALAGPYSRSHRHLLDVAVPIGDGFCITFRRMEEYP